MARVRTNFVVGTVDSSLSAGATSLTSGGLAGLPVISNPDVAVIILDPEGIAGDPEIIHVTAHSSAATTATIARTPSGEGTTARAHAVGIPWVAGATAADFDAFAPNTSLTLPAAASPAQTADGSVVWDSDDDVITVGDGSSRKTFGYLGSATPEDVAAAGANGSGNEVARVNHVHAGSIVDLLKNHVEANTYRGLWASGGVPYNIAGTANGTSVGIGLAKRISSTSGSLQVSTVLRGGYNASTGTTGSEFAGLIGGGNIGTADDFEGGVKTILESEANGHFFFGLSTASAPTDGNNQIGIRVTGTGNIIGYTDSGGSETTRDSGVTPDGSTEHDLRVKVSSGGTVVQFFLDGSQVGADVTTNIPSSTALFFVCGEDNTSTTDCDAHFIDMWGRLEA